MHAVQGALNLLDVTLSRLKLNTKLTLVTGVNLCCHRYAETEQELGSVTRNKPKNVCDWTSVCLCVCVCVCVCARCLSCPGQINFSGPRQPAVSAWERERESVCVWEWGFMDSPCIKYCLKECAIMMTQTCCWQRCLSCFSGVFVKPGWS